MYSLNSGDISYIVPMDYVDLKFLRRHEPIGDNLKPLWSPRQDEYTEFQLKAWRRDTDDEEQQDENATITSMCHICDTQVPVIYLKEHFNSKKHKNFLKIIDEALSRLRNNINLNPPTASPIESSKSTYFCEACCLSVQNNNKEIHEGSAIHKKSTKHDEVIEKLLMTFKKCSSTNRIDTIDNNMDDNNNSVSKNQDLKLSTPLEQLKEYINTITSKMTPNPMEMSVLDENYIVIKVKNSLFKIHIDNFNGFEVKADQGVECLLCHVVVKSKSDHIWTGQHMRWLIHHLVEDQCIRQINQYYSHCIVCNELIRSVGGHKALESNHAIKLKNALYNPLNSETCLQPQTVTRNSATENYTIKENDLNNDEEKQTENIETKYDHYLISRSDLSRKGAVCRLCDCLIPDFKFNIEDHLNGRNHAKKYNDLLSNNRMTKVRKGFSCDFCGIHVPDMTELDHVSSKEHKTKMKIGVITKQTYCEPCMVYIDTHNLKNHQKGRKHKQNASQITANDVAKSNLVDVSKTYAMVTTNTSQSKAQTEIVQNATESIQPTSQNVDKNTPVENNNQPSSGIKIYQVPELKNMQKLMSALDIKSNSENKISNVKNIKPIPSQIVSKSTDAKLTLKLHYQMKETSNPNELICVVCNKRVPNTTDNIITHTNGNSHKNNYKSLLNLNNVVQKESNFYCHKCNVPITNKNEIDHILGSRHKNINNDDDSSTVSDTISDNSNENQKPSRRQRNREYKAKLYFFEESCLGILHVHCRVCRDISVVKNAENVINHTNNIRHINNYNKLLKSNKIAKSNDDLFCTVCDDSIASQNEFNHIYSFTHQQNLLDTPGNNDTSSSSLSYETYCGFCHIYVSVKEYSKHKFSDIHINCVKNLFKGSLEIVYDRTSERSYLKCKLCVICTVNHEYKCAIEHIEGSSHKTAYNKKLDNNKICSVGDKMYCVACKEILTRNEELLHTWQPNHSANLLLMNRN